MLRIVRVHDQPLWRCGLVTHYHRSTCMVVGGWSLSIPATVVHDFSTDPWLEGGIDIGKRVIVRTTRGDIAIATNDGEMTTVCGIGEASGTVIPGSDVIAGIGNRALCLMDSAGTIQRVDLPYIHCVSHASSITGRVWVVGRHVRSEGSMVCVEDGRESASFVTPWRINAMIIQNMHSDTERTHTSGDVVAGCGDSTIVIGDIRVGTIISVCGIHPGRLLDMSCTDLVVQTNTNNILVFDIRTMSTHTKINIPSKGCACHMAWSRPEQLAIVSSGDKRGWLASVDDGNVRDWTGWPDSKILFDD